MATDRLTPATCAVGMRVVCVDASGALVAGKSYTIEVIDGIAGGCVYLDGGAMGPWSMHRFVPASPALPAMTADQWERLRQACADWYAMRQHWALACHPDTELLDAIERTPGLLPAPPSTAPLPAMWCGKDAFEGEG